MQPYTTPGMYGMGQDQAAPGASGGGNMDAMRQKLLMNYLSQQNNPDGGGPAQLGGALISAMLMNPEIMKKAGTGLGNWFGGNQWDGMAGVGTMPALQGQAAANAPALSGGWGGGGVV